MKYLGETLDIHTGGIDLAFPHHENEIAQSEGCNRQAVCHATGCTRSICWSKARRCPSRLATSIRCAICSRKGYKPSALRFALASVPYRQQLNFTFDGLQQATSSVERLRNFADRLKQGKFPAGNRREHGGADRRRRRTISTRD